MRRPDARPVPVLEVATIGLTGLLGLATLAGFLGRWHQVLDLLGCFRLQYALLLIPPVVLFLARRRWGWLLVASAILVVDGGLVAEPYLRASPRVDSPMATLRVLRINLVTWRHEPSKVEAYVRDARPDVLVLSLCSGVWMERLRELVAEPWGGAWHRVRTGDAAIIISRYPLTGGRPGEVANAITLAHPAAALTIFGLHTAQPVHAAGWKRNASQLADLAATVGRDPVRTIVVGDLNVTPWSFAFRRLLSETGLHDTRSGFGNHSTWPANASVGLMRIPIDHALVSGDIGVVERSVGPDVGDPHLPVLIVLEF